MPPNLQTLQVDGIPVVRLESDWLAVDIAPGIGGRVVSLVQKISGHEFLWRNRQVPLRLEQPGAEYDPNFYGGIDELLPNDVPEAINGIQCPDHGELWTTPLVWRSEGQGLVLQGRLSRFGLDYERRMSLRLESPYLDIEYRITNTTNQERHFLWKLHAAMAVLPGDIIECPAHSAQVVDPAWSRFGTLAPFPWPKIQGHSAEVIPPQDGTMDFFYLFDLESGRLGWRRLSQDLRLTYRFDLKVFPYAWLFASYGGFKGHYTVILEPCTTMPISVNDAARKNQCSKLAPGQTLETRVSVCAGSASRSEEGL